MNESAQKKGVNGGELARSFARNHGNLIIFATIWLLAMLFVNNFATLQNNLNIIKQAAIPAITCIGMTFVLMTGGIDLSVGYCVGLCSYLFGLFSMQMGFPPFIALLMTMACGALCGLLNGLLVQYAKIPAFIVTLGTGYILYGLAQIISNGSSMTNLPRNILNMGRTEVLGLPATVFFAIAMFLICYFLCHQTTYGRSLTALGNNINASWLSGIHTARITVLTYVICSTLAAMSAALMTIRVNSATPVMGGNSYTFEAITAAILGGASLTGGVGSVPGSTLGVLTIVVIQNCINLMGVNAYVYEAALSIIILLAIIFEKLKNRALQ